MNQTLEKTAKFHLVEDVQYIRTPHTETTSIVSYKNKNHFDIISQRKFRPMAIGTYEQLYGCAGIEALSHKEEFKSPVLRETFKNIIKADHYSEYKYHAIVHNNYLPGGF